MTESLTQMVRRVADEHPDVADPKALVPFVMEIIDGQEREFLQRILGQHVAAVLRRRVPTESDADEWEGFLGERVPTADGYVFARDADPDELTAGAERRRDFAGNLDRRAVQYQQVAEKIRAEGVATAGDLSLSSGIETLQGLELRILRSRFLRRRSEARIREIAVMEKALADLRECLDSRETPVLRFLRTNLSSLVARRDELRLQISRGEQTDAWVQAHSG